MLLLLNYCINYQDIFVVYLCILYKDIFLHFNT
nr:MAG TPA: hypothetical protein [Bacteriophage sp.]